MSETSSNSTDTVLGRLIVEHGLATSEDVEQYQRLLREPPNADEPHSRSLADLLVKHQIVTKRQVDRLMPQIEEHKPRQQIPGYKIKKLLGSGAMARVYLAKQLSLDRYVAIKVLPRKHTKNEKFVERFYAEGKAAAALNHPNIVGALDVGRINDTHYFVMEYVEGKTVYDEIVQNKRYNESEALEVVIQIASALDHAHEAGFIHRDVKPKNIMIAREGVAKLADMGLVRAFSDREAAEAEKGKAYGTPYYISTEQIRGVKDVDFRADIYSLGATFYHMVTGQVPFDGANPSTVMHKHLKDTLVPPDHINLSLSAGISEIIEVCMAKERDKRFNSSADLLEDLEAVKRGEPPTQARKKFDLVSLAALEQTGLAANPEPETSSEPITAMPVFWIALSGWFVALLLLLVVFIVANR